MGLVVVAVAFALMEPFTYLAHRFVMHGVGMGWHRSHHLRWTRPRAAGESFFERNDWFPVVFAGFAMVGFAIGFNVPGFAGILPVGVGVTLYGLAYSFVHEVYIHQRIPFRPRSALLDRLAEAHALHHRFGGEPYGMLVPVVPGSVRERDRVRERIPATPAP